MSFDILSRARSRASVVWAWLASARQNTHRYWHRCITGPVPALPEHQAPRGERDRHSLGAHCLQRSIWLRWRGGQCRDSGRLPRSFHHGEVHTGAMAKRSAHALGRHQTHPRLMGTLLGLCSFRIVSSIPTLHTYYKLPSMQWLKLVEKKEGHWGLERGLLPAEQSQSASCCVVSVGYFHFLIWKPNKLFSALPSHLPEAAFAHFEVRCL